MASTQSPHSNIALIVCDVQYGILNSVIKEPSDQDAYIANVNSAIATARSQGIKVIFIRVAFRPGHPEISSDGNNKLFSPVKTNNMFVDGSDATKIHDKVDKKDDDVVLTKCRIGAFSTTVLRHVLDSHQINHIVLSGISTSGVILTTVAEAADMDFKITVLSDCCFDANPTVHSVLLEHAFIRRADVITQEAWTNSFKGQKLI